MIAVFRKTRYLLPLALLSLAQLLSAQPKRLVILKVDGLPCGLIEKHINETNSETGRPTLPWIHHIFIEKGTWFRNFYVRGISLSTPSWDMLDTGTHAIIRSNAEFDRLSGRVYDYVNFFPFYLDYARSRRADMPGVEVLDEAGIPLMLDCYALSERYQGFQPFQRGVRWSTLGRALNKGFLGRNPLRLFNEWQTGFDAVRHLTEQMEEDFLEKLKDPRLLYLDYWDSDYDHVAHLSYSSTDQLRSLVRLDVFVGKIWSGIQDSVLAGQTVFVFVSDHGMNSEEGVYSQGYNLLDLFRSGAGGGHHVLMNRHPLGEYKLKGLDPFVSEVVTSSRESAYLEGKPKQYPTAIMDLDGNERASIHLRSSDWNMLHILLLQLEKPGTQSSLRKAVVQAVLDTIDLYRPAWTALVGELDEELPPIRRLRDLLAAKNLYLPKKWSDADRAAGADQRARRQRAQEDSYRKNELGYSQWVSTLRRLLALDRSTLESGRVRVESLVPERIMADANTIHDLQNYVVGPGPEGLVLKDDGNLDTGRSFRRVDYFSLLDNVSVRNVVQPELGSKPVDLVAARVPLRALQQALPGEDRPDQDGIWVYADERHQALLLFRRKEGEELRLRYLPVGGLRQDRTGAIRYEALPWGPGLPLRLWEDPALSVPAGQKDTWLGQWHAESEWMAAVHRCNYSNAVIGLHEYFLATAPAIGTDSASPDEKLIRRFERRLRSMVQVDLLVLAKDHWNFNVRGFNPGGNHGSFLRSSTHSVLMLQGVGIPEGLTVERPCDSLSFAPTVLRLAGREPAGGKSWMCGPVLGEVLQSTATGAGSQLPE